MGLLGELVSGAKNVIKGGGDEYISASESTQSLEDFDEKSISKPVREPINEPEPVSEPEPVTELVKKKKKSDYIEPGEERYQKDYVGITSEKLKSELKTDVDLKPVDATLTALPLNRDEITPAIPSESEYMDLNVPEVSSKSQIVSIPTVNETTKSTNDIITPKTETGATGAINRVLGKFGKRLMTKEEAISGAKGLKGGILEEEPEEKPKEKKKKKDAETKDEEEIPVTNLKEREYAILGGYRGASREQLLAENKSLRANNDKIRDVILKIDQEIEEATKISDAYKKETRELGTLDNETSNARTSQQRLLNGDVERLEKKKQQYQLLIEENNKVIRANNIKISDYDEAVIKGRKSDSTKTRIYKKLQKLGEGASDVQFMDKSARLSNTDWFGQKGFLAKPFKQENITRSPLEPVKTSSRNLDNITRSTGGSVARSMIDVTKVQPNKNIAPMGAPGTIYGARQQFDYSIPARKISLLDASGMTRSNINRDILPSVYSPEKPAGSIMQYKQVIQPDGTVTNVPVPAHYRKSKLFAVSVNRYPKGAKINGMKIGVATKSIKNDKLVRGVESVGHINGVKFSGMNFFGNKPVSKSSKMDKLVRGVESVGNLNKLIKVVPDTKVIRKQFDMGLIDVKNMGVIINGNTSTKNTILTKVEPPVQLRKAKKNSSLVKMGFTLTGVKLNQNLKKLVSKNKTK